MKQYFPLALLTLSCFLGCNRGEQKVDPVAPEIAVKANAAKAIACPSGLASNLREARSSLRPCGRHRRLPR